MVRNIRARGDLFIVKYEFKIRDHQAEIKVCEMLVVYCKKDFTLEEH